MRVSILTSDGDDDESFAYFNKRSARSAASACLPFPSFSPFPSLPCFHFQVFVNSLLMLASFFASSTPDKIFAANAKCQNNFNSKRATPPLPPLLLWLFVVFAAADAAGSRLSYPAMPREIDSVFRWQTEAHLSYTQC